MSRVRALVAGATVLLLVAVGAVVAVRNREPALPRGEVRAFLAAWSNADGAAVDRLAAPGTDASGDQTRFRDEVGVNRSSFRRGPLRRSGDGVTVTVDAVHVVRGLGEWPVRSSVRFVRKNDRWLADWKPSAIHPALERGDRFERQRVRPDRASILSAAGEPLTVVSKVVAVGVRPDRITDQAQVAAVLQEHLGVDPARLDGALKTPGVKPDHFVPLIDLREERYRQVEPVLRPVPGVVFQRHDARTTPAEGFASQTVGRTGEITAEQLEQWGPAYQPGDVVGRSGLESAYERQLGGMPSGEIRLVKRSGERRVLHQVAGAAPSALHTTLRVDVQQAAETALAEVSGLGTLVAVDAATGGLVAVANRPVGDSLNRGLYGRYPPGSTFKIVTTDALIAADGVQQQLACPAQTTVGGKRFRNFEGEALGPTSLRDAFVHSCNTAFVSAAARLSDDQMVAAARRYGFDVDYNPGLGVRNPASFPAPQDPTERVAAAIGQGRVLATPAHMASVMAAAVTGTWRAPHLLAPAPGPSAVPTATPTAAAVAALPAFLRGVVTEGTAQAAAEVPDLLGKTGTAEFGSGNPPPTHAWFLGQRNGIAFAVLLERGGVGGRQAAPIGARFAAAL